MKVKRINAYEKADNKKVVVITLEDGQVLFINYALVKYAVEHVITSKKGE